MQNGELNNTNTQGLQVWKVIGVFAMVFLAVRLAAAFISIGMHAVMGWLNAGENLRVFLGSPLSRAGTIAAVILICAPVIRMVFGGDTRALLFPFIKNSGRDFLSGFALSACVMVLLFAALLATSQLKIDRLALSGQPLDAWLRAIWLAVWVNAAVAAGEEVLFRGLLLTGLKKAWDTPGAVFISAVVFGASQILAAGARQPNWLESIPLLALPGVMLGWAYVRTGNLWLPTGIHFTWNLFRDDILNLASHSQGDSLFGWLTAQQGPTWLLGSFYGIETGLIGVLGAVLVMAGVWLYTRHKLQADQ